jgi:hypothetical protein
VEEGRGLQVPAFREGDEGSSETLVEQALGEGGTGASPPERGGETSEVGLRSAPGRRGLPEAEVGGGPLPKVRGRGQHQVAAASTEKLANTRGGGEAGHAVTEVALESEERETGQGHASGPYSPSFTWS